MSARSAAGSTARSRGRRAAVAGPWAPVLAGLWVVVTGAPAARAEIQLAADLGVSVLATDNAFGADAAVAGARADAVMQASGDASVGRQTARSRSGLSYGVSAHRYGRSEASAVEQRGTAATEIEVGRLTRLALGIAVSEDRSTLLTRARDAGSRLRDPQGGASVAATAGEAPAGSIHALSLGAHQRLTGEAGRWRWAQGLSASQYLVLDGSRPDGVLLGATLGGDRSWRLDGLSLRGSLGHVMAGEGGGGMPRPATTFGEALAGWRRELGPSFVMSLEAGGLLAASLEHLRGIGGPAARASLAMHHRGTNLALEAAHTIYASVYLGEVMLMDRVGASGGIPLGRWERVRLGGDASFNHGRSVSDAGKLASRLLVWVASAAAGYDPEGPLRFSLSYSFVDQRTILANGAGPRARPLGNYRQQAVVLEMRAAFPGADRRR